MGSGCNTACCACSDFDVVVLHWCTLCRPLTTFYLCMVTSDFLWTQWTVTGHCVDQSHVWIIRMTRAEERVYVGSGIYSTHVWNSDAVSQVCTTEVLFTCAFGVQPFTMWFITSLPFLNKTIYFLDYGLSGLGCYSRKCSVANCSVWPVWNLATSFYRV